jgi:inositol-phosphate phosphatase/L-galactose 1-phosphate phosphatase/histidinol-phosphatase
VQKNERQKMNFDVEKQFAGFFEEMAEAARDIALRYFRKNLVVDEKEDKTPVTQADREIEQNLRALIKQKFPAHGVIGEEFGRENAAAEFVWVIDPIDGTKAFATGRPSFGTIIGLAQNGKPVAGLIDQAYTKERWFGVTDRFCRHNGVPVKVAAPRKLSAARFYTTTAAMFEGGYEEGFERLRKTVKWPQYSCDCYAYGLLALGWIDLVMERDLKVHDVIGLAPIISGAGGYAGSWDGNEISLETDGTIIAASTKALALEALAVLQADKAREAV